MSDFRSEFCRKWNSSATLREAIEKTGISSASSLAASYRLLGVKLKRFPRGRKPMDIGAANKAAIQGLKEAK